MRRKAIGEKVRGERWGRGGAVGVREGRGGVQRGTISAPWSGPELASFPGDEPMSCVSVRVCDRKAPRLSLHIV